MCLSEIAQRGDLAVKTLKFSGSKFGVKISLPLDLSSLRLLAGKVANLDLSSVTLTTAELNVLLTALSATTTDSQKRRSLNIRKSSVARISLQPDQFADIVVNKLDELNMSGTNPSEDLLTAGGPQSREHQHVRGGLRHTRPGHLQGEKSSDLEQ